MDKLAYDFVQPRDVKGKIFLTCFPGRKGKEVTYSESIFLEDLNNFNSLGCNTILSLLKIQNLKNCVIKKFCSFYIC